MRNSIRLIIIFLCTCWLCDVAVAKEWRGIVPLHSTRADVKRIFGKPLFEENTLVDIYDVDEGRINIMYVAKQCQQGLPADWGNWNVPPETVANITIHLKKFVPVADLHVPDFEQYRWYTDDSSATYYHDKKEGVLYTVLESGMVQDITYGPTEKDNSLRCKPNAPVIKY